MRILSYATLHNVQTNNNRVYDGHGGEAVAEIARVRILDEFAKLYYAEGDLFSSIKDEDILFVCLFEKKNFNFFFIDRQTRGGIVARRVEKSEGSQESKKEVDDGKGQADEAQAGGEGLSRISHSTCPLGIALHAFSPPSGATRVRARLPNRQSGNPKRGFTRSRRFDRRLRRVRRGPLARREFRRQSRGSLQRR